MGRQDGVKTIYLKEKMKDEMLSSAPKLFALLRNNGNSVASMSSHNHTSNSNNSSGNDQVIINT